MDLQKLNLTSLDLNEQKEINGGLCFITFGAIFLLGYLLGLYENQTELPPVET